MNRCRLLRPARAGAVSLLWLAACGAEPQAPGREVPWTYGPTIGGATTEHLLGTGKKGGEPMAQGWNCRLVDSAQLTVRPFRLAKEHSLFGKAKLRIGLFNAADKQIGLAESPVLTAANATFQVAVDPAVGKDVASVVFWYAAG